MSVSGGNSKEIFELFTNKLVFSVAKMKNQMMILTPISSLDSPLERSASSRIIMKEFLFLFSIWFISLSSNLNLSIDIFIMSVSHVFADFRFIFVKCSCSRRDSTSLFSLFYKIILYIQGSRLRPFFWECASKNLKWSHFVSHTARVSRAEAVCAEWARQHEREGARSGRSAMEDLVFKLK